MIRRLVAGPLLLALAACAPVPRPTVLTELDGVKTGAAAAEARSYAPDAFAHAEKLRAEADAAFAAHDTAGAQLLAERALAAYAHAHALARIARAASQSTDAKKALAAAEKDLAALDADQARASADADALELKLKVARDALPVTPSGKANPERERARFAAARSLAMEARLLCGAARLLVGGGGSQALGAAAPPADAKLVQEVGEAETALSKVEAELAAAGPAAPIDGATRARAGCLAALTAVRRAQTQATRAPGISDALLAEISKIGKLDPSRDDRGVVVTLRGVYGGGAALTPAGEARLTELGKIAAAHATFPVELVIHTDKPVSDKEEAAQRARAEAAARALLKTAGAAVRALPLVAGNSAPVADPAGPERARNARLEIVFVTPEPF